MADKDKAAARPIGELLELRRRLAELEVVDSARRQVEGELRRERDLAQEYLNIVASIIVILDSEARVLLINKKGCEILGCPEAEILGKNWIDTFVPLAMRDAIRTAFEKLVRHEEQAPDYMEHPILDSRGEERIISWHNTVLRDEGGRVIGTLSSGEDITEQKRGQRALEESESKLKSIFKVAPIGLGVSSHDRHLVEVNDHFCKMLGYDREELLGKSACMLYLSQEEFDAAGVERDRQQREAGTATIETRFKRKDGKVIDVLLSLSSIYGDTTSDNIFTVLDITQATRIKRRMEKLNDLFLSLGTDIKENIEKIMQAVREILDCSLVKFSFFRRGQLYYLSCPGTGDFGSDPDAERYISYDLVKRNTRQPMVLNDLEGSRFAMADPVILKEGFRSYLGYPVMVEGRTQGCLSIFDADCRQYSSEEIEIAGILAQALSVEQERLEREEALRDFIDIASHELRHPITIIKGYALSLSELWDDLDRAKREELLQAIELGTDRLNRLALELLDVSRIVRGRFPINKEEVLLVPLLDYAISRFIEKDLGDRCSLIVKNELGSINADPNRILDLVHILVDNAGRFSPPDSRIIIEAARQGGEVLVSVLDQGIGVPEAYREKIFERFFQIEDATHHSKSGMGLGLFIAKEIAEAHGGRIWCEGRRGGGSSFCFALPAGAL
jgi:PAS domain S-box-containing protein